MSEENSKIVSYAWGEVYKNETPHKNMEDGSDHFELAHHVPHRYVPQKANRLGIYSNYGVSALDTVDFALFADLINILMGPALCAEIGKSSGSLVGLMGTIGLMGMTPSLMELMLCIMLLSMEAGINMLGTASRINGKNFHTPLTKLTEPNKFKELKFRDNITSFEKNAIKSMLGAILSAFIFFDEALKDYDEEKELLDLYSILINCFNIGHSFHIQQSSGDALQITSFMGTICSVIFGLGRCSIRGNGLGSHGVYFQKYISKFDFNIHNVILSRLFGAKTKNSFATYVGRLLFCATYSQWPLHIKVSADQREEAIKKDSTVEFSRFMFEDLSYEDSTTSIYRGIGFDTIDLAIRNRILPPDKRNPKLTKIYDNILYIAKNTKDLYLKVTKLVKECPRDSNVCDGSQASAFLNSVPVYNTKFILNKIIFTDVSYGPNKLLYVYEIADENLKKILITMLGNRVSIGMRLVGWFMHNNNLVTFDYYFKFAAVCELLQNSANIANIAKSIKPHTYSNLSPDFQLLAKIFDNIAPIDEKEKLAIESLRETLDPLINLALNLTSKIIAFKSRIILNKI